MNPRILLAIAALGIAAPSYAQQACEKLVTLSMPGLKITSATSIPAGPFTLPGGGRGGPAQVPAFCRVAATVGVELRFEIWMPAQWNNKLLGVGNGGLAGSISYAPMVKPLQEGYATSSTDTGHQGSTNDGSWALGHFDRIVNLADRGVHLMAEADKVILKAFYGAQPVHSYFSGCSLGGHEALIEAQRYPADFDGIIAGDPANNWTHLYQGGHLYTAVVTDGDSYIPASKVHILANAVNNACDMLDGVKDGVLNDPRKCHFNPDTLLCKGSDTSECYTAPQVSAIKKIWTGLRLSDGQQIWPGLMPGGEDGPGGWANWITGREAGKSGHGNLGMPAYKFMLFEDPEWDFHTFRFEAKDGFDSDIDYMDSKLGALFNAVNPDLGPFKARGGKLIQYHGWSDPDITPLNSINYYESVAKMQGGETRGLRKTTDFYRLFMVPGMQHCNGGPGPSTFDMIEPLDRWADKGFAPEKVIASHSTSGAVDRTRPLCPYPTEAQWKGTGSTDDAANFVCALPH
ncbi:MAG TPA: tannase/feruloyl esterase family alpha/beta hydrolase [Bryobacteraceae bacterium]|jgi:feruloyl esterase|nr:tannase/feruloyl esterase family alpha/beta hydrolase [Bryobacteraceae bacterium]